MSQAWTAQDPAFESRVRESFARQKVMSLLGARMDSLTPGHCTIAWPFNPDFTQQHGFAHAGVTALLADSAAGYACFSLMPADSSVLTVSYTIQLHAPARGEALIARAVVVHAGRSLYSARAEVFGDRDELVATLVATVKCLRGRRDA